MIVAVEMTSGVVSQYRMYVLEVVTGSHALCMFASAVASNSDPLAYASFGRSFLEDYMHALATLLEHFPEDCFRVHVAKVR